MKQNIARNKMLVYTEALVLKVCCKLGKQLLNTQAIAFKHWL